MCKENKNNDFIQQCLLFCVSHGMLCGVLVKKIDLLLHKIMVEPLMVMDEFNNVPLLPFWALNVSVTLLSMQGQKVLDFIRNILICVLKMNKGLADLE